MTLGIGSHAPAFTLRDNHRKEVTLDDLKGRKTLVMFFPFAFSGTCSTEICEIRDHKSRIDDTDAVVVAITCDPVAANAAWAAFNDFTYPVLSDFWPHGAVAKAFGVFNEKLGCPNRVTFVLDESGVITDIIDSDSLGEARDFEQQVAALA